MKIHVWVEDACDDIHTDENMVLNDVFHFERDWERKYSLLFALGHSL